MSTPALIDLDAAVGGPSPTHLESRSLHQAIDAIRASGLVLLCDDVGPVRRYDLVASAGAMTVGQAAFLIRHTSGFLQVAMTDLRCDELRLPPVSPSADRFSSQQCVGVDAVGTGTGISAADRSATIAALGRSESVPEDLTRPGHVLPVRVAAHPPATDLAALALTLVEFAGAHAAVHATVVGVDIGSTGLPNPGEAKSFARHHQIPIVSCSDVALAAMADGS